MLNITYYIGRRKVLFCTSILKIFAYTYFRQLIFVFLNVIEYNMLKNTYTLGELRTYLIIIYCLICTIIQYNIIFAYCRIFANIGCPKIVKKTLKI